MKKDQTFIQSLKGWLSGNAGLKEERALHQLAQDDPFLADSWEGYQSTGAEDHEHKLQQIRQRLAHKAEKRKGFPIWLRVAAGGAILIAALFTLRWVNDTSADQIGQSTPELTEQSPIEAPSPGDLEEAIVTTEETPEATSKDEAMPSSPEVSIAKEKAAEAHPRSKERVASRQQALVKEKEKPSQEAAIASQDLAKSDRSKVAARQVEQKPAVLDKAVSTQSGRSAVSAQKEKSIREEGFSDVPEEEAAEEEIAADYSVPAAPASPKRTQLRNISGMVTGPNGQPLIGVTVNVPGTQEGTVTDIDGKYQLPVEATPQQIEFSYVGFQSALIPVAKIDTYNVQLTPTESLSEVVITGYENQNAKKRDKRTTVPQTRLKATGLTTIKSTGAIPVGGLDQINRTIRRKANRLKVDYSQVGKYVELSFRLTPDLAIEDIKVEVAQDPVLNQEAIRLLQLTNWQLQAGFEKTGTQVSCRIQF